MTYQLDNLVENSFQLTYYTGMQPSEVDKLTTYEIRQYISHLNIILESESKNNSSLVGALGNFFSPKKQSKSAPTRKRRK